MIRILLMLMLFCLSIGICWSQSVPIRDSITSMLKKEVNAGRGTCLVVGFVEPGHKSFYYYGNLSKQSPLAANEQTTFEIASLTKLFTTLLLSQMIDEGKLRLSDSISEYLPDSIQPLPLTFQGLATHSSGLPPMPGNFHYQDYRNIFIDYSKEDLYGYLDTMHIDPGQIGKYAYSNLGIGLLGQILSDISGMTYDSLIRKRITGPLKMIHTSDTVKHEPNFAYGYDPKGNEVQHWDFLALKGAGSLRSTAVDMVKFLETQLKLQHDDFAKAVELSHVKRGTTTMPNTSIALAWNITKKLDRNIWWHNGGTAGHASFIGMDKARQRGVIVFCNALISVDDIGFHMLDRRNKIEPYKRVK